MKKFKQLCAIACASAMLTTIAACDESTVPASSGSAPAQTTSTAVTTTDPDENAATDEKPKDIFSEDYTPDGNAGVIKYLGYFDIRTDQKSAAQYLVFNSEQYGGTIEYISTTSGPAYFEKLSTLIAAGDSPDILSYEWQSFPGAISKNVYTPLDEYIDLSTPLWSDIKDVAESFSYMGKHYYYPHSTRTNYSLNYNRKTIEENNLTDPYELYLQGNWTWDTFRTLMIDFCNISEDNIGYCSGVFSALTLTTGAKIVDVQPDGTIVNNILDPNIARAMFFVEDMYRNDLMYNGELGAWVSPELWAQNSDKILFLGMEPEWTYTAATTWEQNPKGVDNDIFDTVSDYFFVPFPRDTEADGYYSGFDTYGYLCAKGATNIKGAVDWIMCNRIYETDPNVAAQRKQDACHPEKVYYTEGKNEGKQRWKISWDEDLYDLWKDMSNPAKFNLMFDDVYGFNQELDDIVNSMLNQTGFEGASWTQLSNENTPLIDAILDEYR